MTCVHGESESRQQCKMRYADGTYVCGLCCAIAWVVCCRVCTVHTHIHTYIRIQVIISYHIVSYLLQLHFISVQFKSET